jgi:membrane-associated phospholipid phosphatase
MIPSYVTIVASLVVVVGAATLIGVPTMVGVDRARAGLSAWRSRLVELFPLILLLCAVVAFKTAVGGILPELSWLVGWNVTDLIGTLEGEFVGTVQSFQTPLLTAYFAGVYVYGFSFLLVFPFVAYFLHEDPRPFQETAVAFSLNYLLGLLAFTLVIAYGPRNYLVGDVEPLLYRFWPAAYLLTSEVATRTDVFPSLHTSMSVTVALLAWRTRDAFPRWTLVSAVLAGSVVVSTMYLGIHWATDVVAGLVLAGLCTGVAVRGPVEGLDGAIRSGLRDLLARLESEARSEADVRDRQQK